MSRCIKLAQVHQSVLKCAQGCPSAVKYRQDATCFTDVVGYGPYGTWLGDLITDALSIRATTSNEGLLVEVEECCSGC